MGKQLENMDSIFRNKLGDYSQSVPDDVWGNIEQALNGQKVVKKFVWYKIAAAVAAIAIVGSSYFYLSNNNQDINVTVLAENPVHENPVKNNDGIEIENKVLTESEADLESKNIFIYNYKKDYIAKAELKPEKNIVYKVEDGQKEQRESFNRLNGKQITVKYSNVQLAIVDNRKKEVVPSFNLLPDINQLYATVDFDSKENSKESKWIVGGEFSPLYSYRHITESNGGYSKDMYNDTESAIMSYTGGLNLQYSSSGRLSVQAGVYYTTMGQALDYMAVYSNAAYDMVAAEYKDRFVNSYTLENSSGDIAFNSQYVIVDEKSVRVNNLSDSKGTADLTSPVYNNMDAEVQQSFQYIEVPVLLRYKLIDKNIDVNLVGGLGANFLVGNDVYLKYSGRKESIGETEGVSSVNYNGTLGFGIEYPLMDRIKIRLEPSVKYYLNEINSSSSVESHPYSIGIYTGVNYSF